MRTKIWIIIEIILGFWKSMVINFKYLPFKHAVRFPILVSHHCQLMTLHGKLKIDAPIKTGMIMMGIGAYGLIDHKYDRTIVDLTSGGVTIFKGTARFGPGTKLLNNGQLTIGNNFNVTGASRIICSDKVTFGDDVLLSWEVLVLDKDYHSIIDNGIIREISAPIHIGNHVWIGCRSTILKGSTIGNDSVVAANSIVNKKHNENNVLIAGIPGNVIKRNINWQK